MPKQSISDITPPKSSKRTILDIPVPARRRQKEPTHVTFVETPPRESVEEMKRPPFRSRRNRLFFIVAGFIFIVVFVFIVREIFKVEATITVTEKKQEVSIEDTFIAKKDFKDGELPFETVSSSGEASKTVPITGEEQVETRAKGTIIIYNDYSSAPQKLIKNTRFETADGRVYRIDNSVVVPGKDKLTGLPGNVEAVVYADTAGELYNIGLSDFTIPGFKGDPRYSKFFARSKTTMTGGFIGKVKTASPEDLKKGQEEIQASLKADLMKKIEAQVPEGFTLFEDAVYFEFETLSPPKSNELKEKASVYALLFDSEKLSKNIASATLSEYNGEDIYAENFNNVVFKPIPLDAKPWQTGVVSFSLSGKTTLTWLFDSEKLKADLVGQPKNQERVKTILQAYPSIDNAEVVVSPFWRKTLPDDASDIFVKIEKVK